MTPPRPSSIRVFEKSLHLLSVGWLATVAWLWIAQIDLHLRQFGGPPASYAVGTLFEGVFPAALVELLAVLLARKMVTAPGTADPRREWLHAFWWTLVPNIMLLGTVYLIITEGG